MKILTSAIILLASLLSAQTVGPPSAAEPVSPDSLSDTAIFSLQVPGYLGGQSIKMRRITLQNLRTAISRDTGSAVFDSVWIQRYVNPVWIGNGSLYQKVGSNTQGLSCATGSVPTQGFAASTDLYAISANSTTLYTGGAANGVISYSTDNGSTFTNNTPPIPWEKDVTGIATNGSTIVAVAIEGRIARSTNGGITYDSVGSGITKNFGNVTWDAVNSQFIGVTSGAPDADILTSPTGVTWTNQTFADNIALRDVACADAICVTVGSGGNIYSSPTGVTWTNRKNTGAQLRGVAYSASLDLWVAGGDSGPVFTSPDGINWTSGNTVTWEKVTWDGTNFIGVGASGSILTSPDGVTWTSRTSSTASTLYSIVDKGDTVYAVGQSGVRRRSVDHGVTWEGFGLAGWACIYKDSIVSQYLASSAQKTTRGLWVFQDSLRTPFATISLLRGDSLTGFKTIRTDSIIAGRGRFSDTVSSTAGVRSANYNAGGLTATFGGVIVPGVGSSTAGGLFRGATNGLNLRGITGSANDFSIRNAVDSLLIANPTGTPSVLIGMRATGGTGSYVGFGLSNGTPINTASGNLSEFEANTALQVTLVGNSAQITGYGRAGTKASPTATPAETNLLSLAGRGYNGSAYTTASSGFYTIRASELWGASATGTYHMWSGTPTGSTTAAEWMRMGGSTTTGFQLLIGTTTPVNSHRLIVTGGSARISELGGSGNQFVCADNNGTLYKSGAACL